MTILSFYAVFIITLLQKKCLHALNLRLQQEQQWHNIAYVDVLTSMLNRTAYIEQINELERTRDERRTIHTVIIDIDDFKKINDTLGHHTGDVMLKKK